MPLRASRAPRWRASSRNHRVEMKEARQRGALDALRGIVVQIAARPRRARYVVIAEYVGATRIGTGVRVAIAFGRRVQERSAVISRARIGATVCFGRASTSAGCTAGARS